MCTNVALVERLECYMDELVDSFEDFVTKSLVVITIAIGGVIAVLIYALKIINDRQPQAILDPTRYPLPLPNKRSSNTSKCSKNCKNNVVLSCSRSTSKTDKSANTDPMSPASSHDEKLLKSVNLSNCCKLMSAPSSKRSLSRKISSSRLTIPSLRTCCPNCKSSKACPKLIASRRSCCSMCCAKDYRR